MERDTDLVHHVRFIWVTVSVFHLGHLNNFTQSFLFDLHILYLVPEAPFLKAISSLFSQHVLFLKMSAASHALKQYSLKLAPAHPVCLSVEVAPGIQQTSYNYGTFTCKNLSEWESLTIMT